MVVVIKGMKTLDEEQKAEKEWACSGTSQKLEMSGNLIGTEHQRFTFSKEVSTDIDTVRLI